MKSDPELMAEFAEGDETAFDMLVKRHQVGLLNFFHRLVWQHALAEDLSQEVFLKLYTHRKDYEPRAKFTTYLYRIARNCWIDYLRRTKTERKNVSLDSQDDEGRSLGDRVAIGVEDPRATVGKDELAAHQVQVKDMETGDQVAVSFDVLTNYLNERKFEYLNSKS